MGAIAVHHTATASDTWDGPAAKTRLKTNQDYNFYKRAFAWRDTEANPATKAAYKFIHHNVDAEGNPGAANIKGCQSGIGVLNGAMGGTNIPSSDRQGVYDHLAAHLKDAKVEPAELSREMEEMEEEARGILPFDFDSLEVREGEGGEKKIVGHGAVYNRLSVDLGGFRELFLSGAFTKSLEKDDIRSLRDHVPSYILGRNRSGTLRLSEDSQGVFYEVKPPDTTYARDLIVSISRGDVTGGSIIFKVNGRNAQHWFVDNQEVEIVDAFMAMFDEQKHDIQRRVVEASLADIGPVTFPAYPQTDVKVRSLIAAAREKMSLASEEEPAGGQSALTGIADRLGLRKRILISMGQLFK